YVIHTVGPVYSGKPGDSMLLSQCYINSLQYALEKNIKSIAFPAISCGVYGYPIEKACKIAIDTTCNFLNDKDSCLTNVIFILFSSKDFEVYRKYLKEVFGI
ncbi:MAG: hypothetical protein FP814_10300, partial [Desulfobacterium sp.]|nr:hypothetical protein [Desulfobacterium sp.]